MQISYEIKNETDYLDLPNDDYKRVPVFVVYRAEHQSGWRTQVAKYNDLASAEAVIDFLNSQSVNEFRARIEA